MPDFQPFLDWLQTAPEFAPWAEILPGQLDRGLSPERWGDLPQWRAALAALPDLTASTLDFESDVRIGAAGDCGAGERAQLREALMALHPWRKGPFNLFGLHLDTEWRSDWKWDRLVSGLAPLDDRLVLDVGCGNGYHCLRMLGAGARRVIGIDPSPRFVHQFYALKRYCGDIPADVLPLGIEHIPTGLAAFDTVFSMGVIYHRRDPVAHIRELIGCLKPGGQMILETLVVDESQGPLLVPEKRYARMRNVWGIPSPGTVMGWLKDCGLEQIKLLDISPTTVDEQRRTEWMRFHSLADFLDPRDSSRTIEGYPAPVRGIFTART